MIDWARDKILVYYLSSATDGTALETNICLQDGGGVKGLTALLVLRRLMHIIQEEQNLEELPRPAQYFDLIAGTSVCVP